MFAIQTPFSWWLRSNAGGANECTTGSTFYVRNSFQSSTSLVFRMSTETGNSFGARGTESRSGAEIVAFEPRGLFNVPLIVAITGISSVSLPANADDKQRNKEIDVA